MGRLRIKFVFDWSMFSTAVICGGLFQVITGNKNDNKTVAANVIPEEMSHHQHDNNVSQRQLSTSAAGVVSSDTKRRHEAQNHHVRTSSADRAEGDADRAWRSEQSAAADSFAHAQKSRTRVQRSRSSVERVTPPRATAAVANERKSPSMHERRPSAQEERLQQLMQRLDSIETSPKLESPSNRRPTATPPQQPQQRKPFSRESIQSTIDNAKRWVGAEHNHHGDAPVEYRQKRGGAGHPLGRPQSFHVADRPVTNFGRPRLGSEERQLSYQQQQQLSQRQGGSMQGNSNWRHVFDISTT